MAETGKMDRNLALEVVRSPREEIALIKYRTKTAKTRDGAWVSVMEPDAAELIASTDTKEMCRRGRARDAVERNHLP